MPRNNLGVAWTAERLHWAVERLRGGVTPSELCAELGIKNTTSLWSAFKRSGLRAPKDYWRPRDAARLGAGPLPIAPPVPDGFRLTRLSSVVNSDGETTAQALRATPDGNGASPLVPDAHAIKGVSTLVDADGNVRQQWVKTRENADAALAAMRAGLERMADASRARGVLDPLPPPDGRDPDLWTLYRWMDPHFGLHAWGQETDGVDWDLKLADRVHRAAMQRLVSGAPPATRATLLVIGDALHADSNKQITPEHGNLLDVDQRWPKVFEAFLDCASFAIDLMLQHHDTVRFVYVPGNHDPMTSLAASFVMRAAYKREPRVAIDMSPSVIRYERWRRCLVGYHHGHLAPFKELPMVMAADRREDWGETTWHAFHTGHVHHDRVLEMRDCRVESGQTLCPKDVWHFGKGYRSGRSMSSITHHGEFGEIARQRVGVAQLGLGGGATS